MKDGRFSPARRQRKVYVAFAHEIPVFDNAIVTGVFSSEKKAKKYVHDMNEFTTKRVYFYITEPLI